MEQQAKKGTTFVFIGLGLFFLAFFVGVSAAGILLMASAISLAGYGAGTIMNSPCEMSKK